MNVCVEVSERDVNMYPCDFMLRYPSDRRWMHVPVSVCVSMDTSIRVCEFANIPVYMKMFLFIKQQTFSRPSVHVRCCSLAV